ncbi:MAG: pentose kinase [Devosia nanyangense]|uniref:Pentose kinase n=1 Tax=Devosia nanyangense TaxID=1228055 RepID=A0A933L306_9HYPH|nr:pentose kinase [Devosia nanyangense]
MPGFVIACDLGTGGNKAALYDSAGVSRAETFVGYPTSYPRADHHEQRPTDWYAAVVSSIRALLAESGVTGADVAAIALSGQSLGCVPLDADGHLLQEQTPIWSDGRASAEAAEFFTRVPETDWYMRTGNGFPPPLYPVFKAMWLRRHAPEVFGRARVLLGSKDYVNFRLTGRIATDHSYASGSGVYDLARGRYSAELLAAAELPPELLPAPLASTDILGPLRQDAAAELGLPPTVKVIAGGVDNSCMALGARNLSEGSVYNSLGSSSWVTVTSSKPVLDPVARPFVFAHVLPGLFNSAMSTFSSGTSLKWILDLVQPDGDYDALFALAATSPAGANRLLFIPTLAGGTILEGGPTTRGGLVGLDLSHTRADVARATLEGVAFSLKMALDRLRNMVSVGNEMIAVGGGARNDLWRQIYADVYGMDVVRTTVDKSAAALGAAALALVATGHWSDAAPLAKLHVEVARASPDANRRRLYDDLAPAYRAAAKSMADLGRMLSKSQETQK